METMEPKTPKYELHKRMSMISPSESDAAEFKKLYHKGINLTIGSISFNIFDHSGIMKQSRKGFHIWPFYKHDPQLGCMKEYHGVSSKIFQAKGKKREECHSKLFIEFQTFTKEVHHEVREIKSMRSSNFGDLRVSRSISQSLIK